MFSKQPQPLSGTVTEYFVTTGVFEYLVGRVYTIHGPDGVTTFVAESHDWHADDSGYVPLRLGAFQDPEEAVNEIERRAREATQ